MLSVSITVRILLLNLVNAIAVAPILHQLVADLFYVRPRHQQPSTARAPQVDETTAKQQLNMHQEVLTSLVLKYIHLARVSAPARVRCFDDVSSASLTARSSART